MVYLPFMLSVAVWLHQVYHINGIKLKLQSKAIEGKAPKWDRSNHESVQRTQCVYMSSQWLLVTVRWKVSIVVRVKEQNTNDEKKKKFVARTINDFAFCYSFYRHSAISSRITFYKKFIFFFFFSSLIALHCKTIAHIANHMQLSAVRYLSASLLCIQLTSCLRSLFGCFALIMMQLNLQLYLFSVKIGFWQAGTMRSSQFLSQFILGSVVLCNSAFSSYRKEFFIFGVSSLTDQIFANAREKFIF